MREVAQGELLEQLVPGVADEVRNGGPRMPRRRGVPSMREPRNAQPALRPVSGPRADLGLLDVRDPHISFSDLLLPQIFLDTFAELHLEHHREALLATHGLTPRRTVLLTGPPGTGKSASADALADEMGRDFAVVNLATVVSSLLGDTARNLAVIFDAAASEPLVLLFDEFDAIAKERAEQTDHGELKRVVTAFLQLLERFRGPSVLLAATNHPDLLDLAVWRRFDLALEFAPPPVMDIRKLLRLKLRPLARERNLDIEAVARACRGFSQAEVSQVVRDAHRRHVLYQASGPLTADALIDAANALRRRPGPVAARG
jgi:ATP-dependent 26S proteasome regulatory subunit